MAEEAKDVKQEEVEESTTEDVNEEESSTSEDDVELFDSQERDIPYSRFKEVNDRKKELERENSKYKSEMDKRIQDEVYRKELELRREYERQVAALESTDDYSYDDYESADSKEVKALKAKIEKLEGSLNEVSGKLSSSELKQELKVLKKIYPAMQDEHVMAIAKIRPNWSWEECAEYSHKKLGAHVQSEYKRLVEQKKQATKRKTVGEGLRSMKPEDKPKSFSEAGRKAAQLLGGD